MTCFMPTSAHGTRHLLPPDDTSFGFDNNGDILGLSPLLLERYLSVANRVTTAALGPTSGIDADVYTHHVDFTVPQREWIEGLPLGTRGGTTFTYRFPVDGEYTIRVKLQRVELAVLGLDEPDEGEPARPQRLEIGLDGARVGLFAITLAKTVKEPLSETSDELLARADEPAKKLTTLEEEQRRATADAGLEVRLFVKAGERRVSVAFLTGSSRCRTRSNSRSCPDREALHGCWEWIRFSSLVRSTRRDPAIYLPSGAFLPASPVGPRTKRPAQKRFLNPWRIVLIIVRSPVTTWINCSLPIARAEKMALLRRESQLGSGAC